MFVEFSKSQASIVVDIEHIKLAFNCLLISSKNRVQLSDRNQNRSQASLKRLAGWKQCILGEQGGVGIGPSLARHTHVGQAIPRKLFVCSNIQLSDVGWVNMCILISTHRGHVSRRVIGSMFHDGQVDLCPVLPCCRHQLLAHTARHHGRSGEVRFFKSPILIRGFCISIAIPIHRFCILIPILYPR